MESRWYAQVEIKWKGPARSDWDWSFLKEWKEVKEAWSTMGEWDLTLWLDLKNPQELEHFVSGNLVGCDWVERTKSSWAKKILEWDQ